MIIFKNVRESFAVRKGRRRPLSQKTMSLKEPLGVFCSTRFTPTTPPNSQSTIASDASEQTDLHSCGSSCSNGSWNSSGVHGYHKSSPLIVADPEASQEITDEAAALGKAMQRSKQLPTTWYYQSNHVMVNMERTHRAVAPLVRLRELDELAASHAQQMVREARLYHLDPQDIMEGLGGRPARRLGCNVNAGVSIEDIHTGMMATAANRNNIIDRRYTHMGMATARDKDGELYLCQIFRG